MKPDKFEKTEELYKKYRNYIIELAKNQYVSPTRARKGLAGDACAIIRIHNFLENWGLINYMFPKNSKNNELPPSKYERNFEPKLRKDCIDKDKTLFEKNFDKDYLELMKKITRKYRPACHLCEGICGTTWYEYKENLVLKKIVKTQKGEKTKTEIERADESFEYLLRVCASCLINGSIPIIFSSDNFEKKNLLEDFQYSYEEPKDKKRTN